VFGVTIWGVFPSREDENGGAEEVRGGGVGSDDGVPHRSAHAFLDVFSICHFRALLGVWGVATVGGDDDVFWIE
jgi:hypothetical protein